MILQPQLYIDTSGNPLGEPTFERVDFFDFESIELNSSFQDVRDISKVFTDYSKTFSVPASSVNNKIFRHYYNSNIDDGFDARIKQRAEIYLNGVLFKVGYARLTKATFKDSRPHAYRVTFFGALTKIQNVIGVSELSELSSLDKYNHIYNLDNVNGGFTTGLELSGSDVVVGSGKDIVYPSISASDKWEYNSTASTPPETFNQGVSRNIYDSSVDGSYGINYLTLKPAIKVKHIISAIEEKYSSIDFSDDFFGTAEFDDLYMLLHNNKGALAPKSSTNADTSVTYRIGSGDSDSDFRLDSGNTERRPMLTYWEDVGFTEVNVIQYHVIVDISNVTKSGGGTDPVYTMEVLDGNIVIDRSEGLNGDAQITSVLCSENRKEWDNISVRISSTENELATFELNLELQQVRFKVPKLDVPDEYICDVQNFINSGGTPETESSLYSTAIAGVQSLIQRIEITKNMPKMKIIDFLTGIFKTFNLTSIVGDGGQIQVKPLIDFYNSGSSIDISKMVDKSELEVNRMDLFKNISFNFSEPKTFGIINNNELAQTDFGNLDYESVANGTDASLIFDGKDYKVKLPFEKVYYERLFDENTNEKTSFGNGWLVDKDQNEVVTKPILFFNVVQPVDTSKFRIGFLGKSLISQYNRASNSNASEYWTGTVWYVEQGTKSINFNGEFDEFTNTLVARGLFSKYYSDYISSVFDKKTRIFKLKMKASISFLLRYKINDTLVIDGENFLINNIRTNINTGVTDLELILKFFSSEDIDPVGDPLTTPTGLSSLLRQNNQLTFNWLANPDGELVKGYKVYVDGVLTATLLRQTSYTLSGLTSNTSYDIQISAYDAQGNESSLTSVVAISTTSSDSEAPTIPANFAVSSYDDLSVSLSWSASTDNVGVTGYEVYVDGVLSQTITATSTTIFGLTSNTTYTMSVRAKDGVPNYSGFATLQIRTL